jgi:hypothetical protein
MFRRQLHVKEFIKSGAVQILGGTITEPKHRVNKYDFITFKRPRMGWFIRLIRKRFLRLREHHLLIRYKSFSIFYLKHPAPRSLFFFFKFSYANIFFTPRNP